MRLTILTRCGDDSGIPGEEFAQIFADGVPIAWCWTQDDKVHVSVIGGRGSREVSAVVRLANATADEPIEIE